MGNLTGAHNFIQAGAHIQPINVPTLSPCPVDAHIAQITPMWGPHGHVGWVITFSTNMASHSDMAECLYQAYPLLRGAGGFTLARSDRRRELNPIPIQPSGYSIAYLRTFCKGKRTPIYIVPLQKPLVLQPQEENVSAMSKSMNSL